MLGQITLFTILFLSVPTACAEGFTPYCRKLRTQGGPLQEILVTLKPDPLFDNEYGDRFFPEPAQVELLDRRRLPQ